MAALSGQRTTSVVELGSLTSAHMAPLLEEEAGAWRADLNWDFRPSADLVRRFVDLHALTGFGLIEGPHVSGYAYYVCEDAKGLVGDLYVVRERRTIQTENTLLSAVLDAMWQAPGIRRIEAQLMMLQSPLHRPVPYGQWFHSFPRRFFEAPLARVSTLPARTLLHAAVLPWSEEHQSGAADLIAAAYRGHIDSQINDQYRTAWGARRFLANIVQYPGCGSFFAPASFVATDLTGSVCGMCLASLVAADAGHITQVCVAPEHRGSGLGYELMRRSLGALAANGCRSASLTVTSANTSAIRLYERMGFASQREFAAYVWELR